MSYKEKIHEITNIPLKEIPSGYQMIGDIIILNVKNNEYLETIARATKTLLPQVKTICAKTGWIKGEYREPQVKKILGEDTETIHHEHDCKFKMDVTKTMWAKGNLHERQRIASLVGQKERVLDMFAGIGYFTIPIAVHNPTAKIISIEKNPVAAHYLRENVLLNKLSNVKVINDDSKTKALEYEDWATRVMMGYIPEPREFLDSAFTALDEGVIHYEGVRECGEEDTLYEPVKEAGEKNGYRTELQNTQLVKSYGPHRSHVVVDVKCLKKE